MRVVVIFPFRPGCEHREAAKETVSQWWETAVPEWEQVTVDDGGEVFSRGGSLNEGVRLARPDVIIAADADLLIGRAQILEAVEAANASPGLVQPFASLHWYDERATHALLSEPWKAFYQRSPRPLYRWEVNDATPLVGGLNVLSFETWKAVGGWPDKFRGWGHEDLAFAAACRTLVAPHRKISGTVHHLFHPRPIHTPYADADTIAANEAEVVRWLAADGDPAAMRELVNG